MSRKLISAVPLPPDRAVHAVPSHLIDATEGMEVPIGGAREILLHIRNDGPSVATVIVRGGDPSVSPVGNGEDERVQVSALETRFVGPIESSAFAQPGGHVWIDFTRDSVGRITAYRID